MSSLKKSHSKLSNSKLTMLCIVAIISISLFWIFLAQIANGKEIMIILTTCFGLLSLLCLVLFNAFKR